MESRQGLKFSLKLSLSLFFTSFTFCMCKHKTTERAKDTKLSQRHCGGRQVHPWRRLRRPTLSVAIWNGCQHLLPLVVVRTKLHTTVPTTLNFFILPLEPHSGTTSPSPFLFFPVPYIPPSVPPVSSLISLCYTFFLFCLCFQMTGPPHCRLHADPGAGSTQVV